MDAEKLKQILLYSYAVPFFCWGFDVSTTYYALNRLDIGGEANPLGWPFGALGALIFYIPALAFTYLLLFKVRYQYSPSVAFAITASAFWIGIMNLQAGLHNWNNILETLERRGASYSVNQLGLASLLIVFSAIIFYIVYKSTREQPSCQKKK